MRSSGCFTRFVRRPWDHRRTAFAQEEGAETNPVRNHFPAAEWLEKAMLRTRTEREGKKCRAEKSDIK